MNEKTFLDFVACDGLGYALLDGSYIEHIEDKKMQKKAAKASQLLKEIEGWLENHPDYEVM